MVYYKSDDGRILEQTDFSFDDYDISYVQCSHGDVIRGFYDGKSLGILLADTMGHDKDTGESFAKYLDENVRPSGWGTGEPSSELERLAETFPRDSDEELASSLWRPVGALMRLGCGKEQIAHAGIERPLYMKNDGSLEVVNGHGFLEYFHWLEHYPTQEKKMESGDMLMMYTDGVTDNMAKHGHDDPFDALKVFLEHNRKSDAGFIASRMTDPGGFGYMMLPWDDMDDDISLVLVKKK